MDKICKKTRGYGRGHRNGLLFAQLTLTNCALKNLMSLLLKSATNPSWRQTQCLPLRWGLRQGKRTRIRETNTRLAAWVMRRRLPPWERRLLRLCWNWVVLIIQQVYLATDLITFWRTVCHSKSWINFMHQLQKARGHLQSSETDHGWVDVFPDMALVLFCCSCK